MTTGEKNRERFDSLYARLIREPPGPWRAMLQRQVDDLWHGALGQVLPLTATQYHKHRMFWRWEAQDREKLRLIRARLQRQRAAAEANAPARRSPSALADEVVEVLLSRLRGAADVQQLAAPSVVPRSTGTVFTRCGDGWKVEPG